MPVIDQSIVLLYAYVPALVLALFFWWIDRYEREPIFLVLMAFLWGSLGALWISAFFNQYFQGVLFLYLRGDDFNSVLSAVMVAPFVEEVSKGFFILVLLYFGKIDNITDGLLMGIVVGLGFAASENVFYAGRVYESSGEIAMWNNLWFREIHSTLIHAASTAILGTMIGYSKYSRGIKKRMIIINGMILAVVSHGFWNFLASYMTRFEGGLNFVKILMRIELVLIFAFLLGLFFVLLRKQRDTILIELTEESQNGIIPAEHIPFFASLVRFPLDYDFPKYLDPKLYARLGAKLAFRKHEYRLNPSYSVLNEIDTLRERIREMACDYTESLKLSYEKRKP